MPASFTKRLERINYNGEISQLCLCIFTDSVMDDPVTFWSGYTYNRLSIMQLFRLRGYPEQLECPITRLPIYIVELRKKTNATIKNEIAAFVETKELEYQFTHPEYIPPTNDEYDEDEHLLVREINQVINRVENFPQSLSQQNQFFYSPPSRNAPVTTIDVSAICLRHSLAVCKILATGFVSGASIGFMGGKIAEQLYLDESNQYDAEYASMATATGLSIICLSTAMINSWYQKRNLNDWLLGILCQFLDRSNDRIVLLIFNSLLIMPISSLLGAYLLDIHDPYGEENMTLLQYTYTGLIGAFPIGWSILPLSIFLSGGLLHLLEEAIGELHPIMANQDPSELEFLEAARLEI